MSKDKLYFDYNQNNYFQYYEARVDRLKPLGFITVVEFIRMQKESDHQEIFQRIATAEANGDNKLKAELKQNNLRVFTPCVIIGEGTNGRPWKDYAHIERFTGLAVLDFDHIPTPETAIKFKLMLFHKFDCIIAAWLSPSKHGVKALVSIPIVNTTDDFKAYYWGLENEFKKYGEYGKQWFDPSGQNSTLSLFQSYDPDLLVAEEFTTWTTKGEKKNAFNHNGKKTPPPNIDVTDKDRQTVVKIIQSGMGSISDPGHPQLRALCISVGGYIAAGYIDNLEATQLIDHLIESHHYLNKGVSGYKKTAHWAIDNGKLKPLQL